jgi:hypothetical protein
MRQVTSERRSKSLNPASIRRVARKDDRLRDPGPAPTTSSGNLRREPDLPVERGEHLLEVWHNRLGLDHEQPSGRRVPGQQVDAPSLAADPERHFYCTPPAYPGEDLDQSLSDRRMDGIEQPVELFASPAHSDVQLSAQTHDDPLDRIQGGARNHAPLDPRDCRLRNMTSHRQVRLPPAQSLAERPNRPTEPLAIHRSKLARAAQPTLTYRCGGSVFAKDL